jgi:hypothetical protein
MAKSQISPPIIDHLGLRDLQIMPLKPGWREYWEATSRKIAHHVFADLIWQITCHSIKVYFGLPKTLLWYDILQGVVTDDLTCILVQCQLSIMVTCDVNFSVASYSSW